MRQRMRKTTSRKNCKIKTKIGFFTNAENTVEKNDAKVMENVIENASKVIENPSTTQKTTQENIDITQKTTLKNTNTTQKTTLKNEITVEKNRATVIENPSKVIDFYPCDFQKF
jgi:hypothetical protein